MKTIFLAEGETHVLKALRLLLEQQPDLLVVGEARSVEAVLAQVCHHAPDVILLDWNLPGFHPQRSIKPLRECCPATRLVVISVKPEHESASREYGLDAFVSKQLPADLFAARLLEIFSGSQSVQEVR